jgi:thiol:disulfide interchange protein DsbG
MKKMLMGLLLAIVVVTGGIYFFTKHGAVDKQGDVLSFIKKQGVTIIDSFETPSELTGYIGTYKDEPMSIYVTADKRYAVVGDLIDAEGKNLGAGAIYQLVTKPQNEKLWQQLEQTDWVQDGDKNAPRIVYTFTDPFCPYCHKFRDMADPFIAEGKVQFRHILVGILQENSLAVAATIMGSDSPEEAFQQHRQLTNKGGITVDNAKASKGNDSVLANNHLMEALHMHATPTSVYKDNDGEIQIVEGMPVQQELSRIFEE